MAHPGQYPPMQQPMGGPPMPQMGGPPMMPPRPMTRGTSRVVPVVVSAGLAVGVFCGLLFGLGTGKRDASAEPSKGTNNVKHTDDSFTPESMANPNAKPTDKTVTMVTPDASPNAGSADPTIKPGTKLTVEIKPENVAATAKVLVDGKPIEGFTAEIPPDPDKPKKVVTVTVKAPGYHDQHQDIEADGSPVTLRIELSHAMKSSQPPTDPGTTTPPPTNNGGTKSTGGTKSNGGSKSNGGTKSNGGSTQKPSGGIIDI
jgi:hypothetical protein